MSSWKSRSITDRGFMFSLDAVIASMLLLFAFYTLIISVSSFAGQGSAQEEYVEKEMLALAVSEAIVKNRNMENPSTGAAYFNSEKMRVEQNVIDPALVSKATPMEFGKYELSAIYERNRAGKKYFFEQERENCIVMERFVLMKELLERKTIIGVEVCEK